MDHQKQITMNILVRIAVGLISLGQALAAPVETDLLAESRRIVSQHKAVFTKMPVGLAPYSTDAILLGNGDIAMSISMTPLAKGGERKKRESGNIRFWFHKNDMWSGGARSVALIDTAFGFARSAMQRGNRSLYCCDFRHSRAGGWGNRPLQDLGKRR